MPNERMFPIMHKHKHSYVPWAMLAPHEARAKRNHMQDLEELASRGGLCPSEAMSVLLNIGWGDYPGSHEAAKLDLDQHVKAWELTRDAPNA